MAQKERTTRSSAVKTLIGLIPNLICVAYSVTALIGIEARFVGKRALCIIILSFFAAALLTSAWLCLLTLLTFYLISLHWSLVAALLSAFGLNAILLVIVALMISNAKKDLFFPATIQQLRKLKL